MFNLLFYNIIPFNGRCHTWTHRIIAYTIRTVSFFYLKELHFQHAVYVETCPPAGQL